MLQQISWLTYSVCIISLALLYYLYVGLVFYKKELKSSIFKLTGKQPYRNTMVNSDLHFPDSDIMGKAQPEDITFISPEELSFGPAEEAEEPAKPNVANSRLIGSFSEMISEVKTLIRVINESGETKENFEMLFKLIVQKYQVLRGTTYQQQINDFLMAEGVHEFPFSINDSDLKNYWTEEN